MSASTNPPRGLLLPLHGTNGATPTIISPHCSNAPALCTPIEVDHRHTPPPELRRESMNVPPSARMIRLAHGSGVSVYRMDRSPKMGRPRSPWVLKKANVSPFMVRPTTRPPHATTHPPDSAHVDVEPARRCVSADAWSARSSTSHACSLR